MGRQQTFATVDAVRAARGVFWRRGYEDASLPELEAATGLRRSSLYNTFGSKRGLFDAAVANYLDEVVHPRLRPFTAAQVAPSAVTDYFGSLRSRLAALPDGADAQGCLLLNSAAAPIGHDGAVRAVVDGYADLLRSALERGVLARWPQLPPDVAALRARTLAAVLVSTLLMVRVDRDKAVEATRDVEALVLAWDTTA